MKSRGQDDPDIIQDLVTEAGNDCSLFCQRPLRYIGLVVKANSTYNFYRML